MRHLSGARESVSGGLDFIERTTILMGSATYRWLDIKRFSLAPSISDGEVLAALMRHERYQDHYANDEANWSPTDDLHGPYRLSLLGPESFARVTPAAARQTLRDWAEECDGVGADGFLAVMRAVEAELHDTTTVLHLIADRESQGHDWGWVLGDFHEFVVFDRPVSQLCLVVASDD